MNNKTPLYLLIVILIILNVATLSYLFGTRSIGNHMYSNIDDCEEMMEHMEEDHSETGMMHREVDYNKPVAETHNKTYDFGKVSKSEGVQSTIFEIENHGRENLEIGEISTSCGCTSAEIDNKTIGFNEEAELTVYFDPNYHEEPEGQFTRSVFVQTNDPDMSEMQFDIFIEIVD